MRLSKTNQQRLSRSVRFTEQFSNPENGKRSNKQQRIPAMQWVKVTGVSTVDTDAYNWTAVRFLNTTSMWEDQATTGDLLYEANEQPLITNQIVKLEYAGYDTTNDRYWYVCVSPEKMGQMFAVNVTKTGGLDGDNDTKATWTYTAKTLDNVTTLGTVMTPTKERPRFGKITNGDGKVGLGYYNTSGTFILYDANEVMYVEEC